MGKQLLYQFIKTMNETHRNRAVRVLKQLTKETIQSFNRDEVVGRLGLTILLSPSERILCQQQLQHLQERLAYHNQKKQMLKKLRLQEMQAYQSEIQQLQAESGKNLFAEKPSYANMKQAITSEPVPVSLEQQFTIKNNQPQPALNQPFVTMNNQPIKQESKKLTPPPQNTSRLLSIFEPFSSLFKKSSIFHQKRQSSQEFSVDEQRKALILEDQEDTRSSYKDKKNC